MDSFILPKARFYPTRITIGHHQLRNLIASPEPDILYAVCKTDVYELNLKTNVRSHVAHLPRVPRCTACGHGWIVMGIGDAPDNSVAIINTNGDAADVDDALPVDPERRREPKKASLRIEHIGDEIVNSVSIHKLQGTGEIKDDVVAVLTNNDKTVRIFSLSQHLEMAVLDLHFQVNHATISPDGQFLIAVGDWQQAYFFERIPLDEDESKVSTSTYASGHCSWELLDIVDLHVPKSASISSYFCTAWSSSGHLCAVASENGYITVFDTQDMVDGSHGEPKVLTIIPSSRPFTDHGPGAVRVLKFAPSPWDLLIWVESQARVCVADLRSNLQIKQVVELNPDNPELELIQVVDDDDAKPVALPSPTAQGQPLYRRVLDPADLDSHGGQRMRRIVRLLPGGRDVGVEDRPEIRPNEGSGAFFAQNAEAMARMHPSFRGQSMRLIPNALEPHRRPPYPIPNRQDPPPAPARRDLVERARTEAELAQPRSPDRNAWLEPGGSQLDVVRDFYDHQDRLEREERLMQGLDDPRREAPRDELPPNGMAQGRTRELDRERAEIQRAEIQRARDRLERERAAGARLRDQRAERLLLAAGAAAGVPPAPPEQRGPPYLERIRQQEQQDQALRLVQQEQARQLLVRSRDNVALVTQQRDQQAEYERWRQQVLQRYTEQGGRDQELAGARVATPQPPPQTRQQTGPTQQQAGEEEPPQDEELARQLEDYRLRESEEVRILRLQAQQNIAQVMRERELERERDPQHLARLQMTPETRARHVAAELERRQREALIYHHQQLIDLGRRLEPGEPIELFPGTEFSTANIPAPAPTAPEPSTENTGSNGTGLATTGAPESQPTAAARASTRMQSPPATAAARATRTTARANGPPRHGPALVPAGAGATWPFVGRARQPAAPTAQPLTASRRPPAHTIVPRRNVTPSQPIAGADGEQQQQQQPNMFPGAGGAAATDAERAAERARWPYISRARERASRLRAEGALDDGALGLIAAQSTRDASMLGLGLAGLGGELAADGVPTTGLVVAPDGARMWVGCDRGVFEFVVDRRGRMGSVAAEMR